MPRETPMLRQYRQIKARYPDALVLYRLGDFYELFEADAQVAARDLDLVLTSRRFSKELRLPMCGVPYRTVTTYIARLLEHGHKVALVEQLEDARQAKGLIKRDVVRVITPGTVVEDELLPEKAQNYLAAIAPGKHGYGLALVDLSTGEFAVTFAPDSAILVEELERLQPSELIWPSSSSEKQDVVAELAGFRPARFSSLPDADFEPAAARDRLCRHLGVASLEAYGCDELPLATAAAGAILAYIQNNQPNHALATGSDGLMHLRHLTTYDLADHMHLDSATRRNLELVRTLRDGRVAGSLLSVLDHTATAMGARLLRRWINQPLTDLVSINERLDAVAELVGERGAKGSADEVFMRVDLQQLLDGVYDMERLLGRIGFGNANGRDLIALKKTLQRWPQVKTRLASAKATRLQNLAQVDDQAEVLTTISQALVDRPPVLVKEGGLIRSGYDVDLDQLRARAKAGRNWLSEYEAQERERTGIKNLRIKYNEVFGFFIEVTKSNLDRVPEDYERRATITHAERFITPELKIKETEILAAEDRAKELEYDLFVEVRRRVAERATDLRRVAHALAEIDTLVSLAEAAVRHNYVRPAVEAGGRIAIVEGRHPVVECLLPASERFVPNDASMDQADQRLLVITGPNMAGKSVYIRQVALTVLMAQIGSFCPAQQARIGLADRIFVRAGASDDITQGRSTFLVEMSETAYILNHASPDSLIVLDEVGRGTSTYDGMGLAWAVGEYLHDHVGARTLFATHYHELTGLAEVLSGARNYTLAVKERGNDVIFLRRLVPGGADRSYGIHVARLAGLPQNVVQRAQNVMTRLEQERRGPDGLGELEGGVRRLVRDQPERGVALASGRELGASGEAESFGLVEGGGQNQELKESNPSYVVTSELGDLVLPAEDKVLRQVLWALFKLDIANLTPIQALVRLNEWQSLLRGKGTG